MNVKILGSGCPSCRSMYNDVNRIIARNQWQGVDVEYVQDIQQIMSYGVMATPVLVVNEKVVMVGHRGSTKIEDVLRKAGAV
jgi:predicted DsbA family dithiol-disulfide isomerase